MAATPVKTAPKTTAGQGDKAGGRSSESPADGKSTEEAASLSAKMGGLALTEKEAAGFVFDDPGPRKKLEMKWAVVGKAFSPRPLNKHAFERAMQRAWGLHREAQFKELGGNIFMIRFGSEGDWKHALHNGPWQFDFNVVVLKDYDGEARPSEMVFDSIEVWVRVDDLPLDKRTKAFGEALGNWLGTVVKVDVGEDGLARGTQLRVRARIALHEPLVRGFYLKKKPEDEEKTWFDFSYERVPHFCFDCGRLVHVDGNCDPPVDPLSQWGEWLRASPGRSSSSHHEKKQWQGASSKSFSRESSMSSGGVNGPKGQGHVRDLPTRRSLYRDYTPSADSYTGRSKQKGKEQEEVLSPHKMHTGAEGAKEKDLRQNLEERREKELRNELHQKVREGIISPRKSQEYRDRQHGRGERSPRGQQRRPGYYVRKPRRDEGASRQRESHQRYVPREKKRPSRQMWVPVGDGSRKEGGDALSGEKRQKVSSVFERIGDHGATSADLGSRGRREQ